MDDLLFKAHGMPSHQSLVSADYRFLLEVCFYKSESYDLFLVCQITQFN